MEIYDCNWFFFEIKLITVLNQKYLFNGGEGCLFFQTLFEGGEGLFEKGAYLYFLVKLYNSLPAERNVC